MKRIGLFLLALTLFIGAKAAISTVNVDSLTQAIISNSKEIQDQIKDSVMFSKLSADQILELKKGEQMVRRQEIENEGRQDMPFNGFQLILVVLAPFIFVTLLVYITSRAKKEEMKRRYDLYNKSLEMGQNIPEHFFDEPKKSNQNSNLKRGILWLAVGLGLLIYFIIMHKNNALIGGILPAFIGVGYLLVYWLDKPKTNSPANNDEQHR